ncbi:pseudouridine synthase [Halobacteriovorax sp.]|uniref:pseudouridine synthase n=1 Tax=Halobacteriovorax sp. TaxID=2020862 RepID=UPI0035650F42
MEIKKFSFRGKIKDKENITLVDFLAEVTPLSKSLIKKHANNGGVWIKKRGLGPLNRIRRVKTVLTPDDYIECHYDPNLPEVDMSLVAQIHETKDWGIWYKPAGILTEGTKYGDQASMIRHIEKIKPHAYPIQRLDRETSGLMIVAYKEKVSRIFTKSTKSGLITKSFQAEVLGQLRSSEGDISFNIDGRSAKTIYKVHQELEFSSLIEIEMPTSRFHQARQHLAKIKHPIIGDPKYGRHNKNDDGLKLVAHKIELKDPISKKDHLFVLSDELRLF